MRLRSYMASAGMRCMNEMMSLSDIRDLTSAQRSAHLAYRYMRAGVTNGGHEQFISNHADH